MRPEGIGRGRDALNYVRLSLVDGDGDSRAGDKLGEAAGVVRVGMRNDNSADPVAGNAAVHQASLHDAGASRKA